MKYLMKRVVQWNRDLIVYLFLAEGESVDIFEILHQGIHQLNVISTPGKLSKITANSMFVMSLFLTHLSVTGHVAVDESVIVDLNKAVKGKTLWYDKPEISVHWFDRSIKKFSR